MFTKTMKFEDLDGNEVEETFYFNYTIVEIGKKIEFDRLEDKIKRLTTTKDVKGLSEVENTREAFEIFEELILDAYGVKGEDNRKFIKNDQLREGWKNHLAFPELVIELIQDEDLAAKFMEGCLPKSKVEAAKAELAKKPSSEQISEMVQTAADRQANPETAIAPGTPPAKDEAITEGKTDSELLAAKPVDLSKAQLVRLMQLKTAE